MSLYVLGFFMTIVLANFHVIQSTKTQVFSQIAQLPDSKFCLVLGANPYSEACQNRLSAAAELYKKGKVKHILVSGDNSRKDYNEPVEMKKDLIRMGVIAGDITVDYAGFRTLDSIYRAKNVFNVHEMIIVTQEFHANRAVYLANAHKVEAVAYTADKTQFEKINKTRELAARMMALLDVIIRREAHFTGPFEPIASR